ELSKGKEFIKGKIALRLEDSEEMAHLLGKYELLYGKIKTVEEIARGVDAVTAEDVQRVARELLAPENLRIAAIGPVEGLR
ncbi:MAG: peptidase M16 protein, partial [uncultured bacterium]